MYTSSYNNVWANPKLKLAKPLPLTLGPSCASLLDNGSGCPLSSVYISYSYVHSGSTLSSVHTELQALEDIC